MQPAAAADFYVAWVLGDAVLRAFAGDHYSAGLEPVLWPEHLDVAITVDEVNYGISPGDDAIAEPYAYVGPHRPRQALKQPFGAACCWTASPRRASAPSSRRATRSPQRIDEAELATANLTVFI